MIPIGVEASRVDEKSPLLVNNILSPIRCMHGWKKKGDVSVFTEDCGTDWRKVI